MKRFLFFLLVFPVLTFGYAAAQDAADEGMPGLSDKDKFLMAIGSWMTFSDSSEVCSARRCLDDLPDLRGKVSKAKEKVDAAKEEVREAEEAERSLGFSNSFEEHMKAHERLMFAYTALKAAKTELEALEMDIEMCPIEIESAEEGFISSCSGRYQGACTSASDEDAESFCKGQLGSITGWQFVYEEELEKYKKDAKDHRRICRNRYNDDIEECEDESGLDKMSCTLNAISSQMACNRNGPTPPDPIDYNKKFQEVVAAGILECGLGNLPNLPWGNS